MNSRIDADGKIFIPLDIRQALKLSPGQEIDFSYIPQTRMLILTPCKNTCDDVPPFPPRTDEKPE